MSDDEINYDALNNRAMKAGVWVYGLASLVTGIFDLLWRGFDSAHQPIQAWGDNIPGYTILACITGIWMIAGGAAILWRRSARMGGAALAIIYFIFTVFWLPRLYTAPHILGHAVRVYIGVLAGVGSQLIAVPAGALVYSMLAARHSLWQRWLVAARWIFGVCSVIFGLAHLSYIKESTVYVPGWMPLGGQFWVVLTGICFILAGVAILARVMDVVAARMLSLMFLAFNLFSLPHFIIADPKDHAAWGGNAFNFALAASVWIFAESLAGLRAEGRPARVAVAS